MEKLMFGKSEWFQDKKVGYGLHPICWQGWAYVAAWVAVACLPFVTLLATRGVFPSLTWIVASLGMLAWDVRQIKRVRAKVCEDDLFYIGEESQVASLNTPNYELHLRD